MFHARSHILGLFAGLAVAGWSVGDAQAVPTSVRAGTRLRGSQAENALIVNELHKAKLLLEEADHDYDGYRAKAVVKITEAIHALGHSHPAGKPGEKKPGEKKPGEKGEKKEPQAKSDAQLREALTILGGAHTKLLQEKGEPAKKGAQDVAAAIKDLNTALMIK